MSQFLHGVEVINIDDGSRPIQTVRSAVIGLIGTAPNALPAVAASLILGSPALNDCFKITAKKSGREGNAISVETVIGAELAADVTDNKITVTVLADSSASDVVTFLKDEVAVTTLVDISLVGTGASEVGAISKSYLSGGEDEPFPLNKAVIVAGSKKKAEGLGIKGTLPNALDDIFDQTGALVVVVRVEEGADDAATQSNVIAGTEAWLYSKIETGYQPRILIAPEFSQFPSVAAEIEAKAQRLRGVFYRDCERTATVFDAMKVAKGHGKRTEVLHPWVRVFDTTLQKEVDRPLSGRAAGLRARIDAEKGFWWSKSNNEIFGIVGTSQPIDWSIDDPNTTANLLNENKVSTVIREGGFKFWGNRNCSTDPKWHFEMTVRTADIINDSVCRSHMWAVDQNITKTFVDDVTEGVNAYLRELKSQGAIINGSCWADKELNTPATIQKGHVYFDFDFCPPYPSERITFRSRLNNGYLDEVFS